MKLALLWVLSFVTVTSMVKPSPDNSSKRPKSISPELYCVACQAVIRETLKRLHHKTKESDVMAAMDDLCDLWKYKAYDYAPPEMRKGCNALLEHHEEDLEWALTNRERLDEDVETYFCHRKTKACSDPEPTEPNFEDIIAHAEDKGPVKKAKIVTQEHTHSHHHDT